MTTSYHFYTLKELKEREVILSRELERLRQHIIERESTGTFESPIWESVETIERKMVPRMILPTKVPKEDELREIEKSKVCNEGNKQLILLAKSKIQESLEEALPAETFILPKRTKKILLNRAKPIPEEHQEEVNETWESILEGPLLSIRQMK